MNQTPPLEMTPEEQHCAKVIEAAIAFARGTAQDATISPEARAYYGETALRLENIFLRGQQARDMAAWLVGDRLKAPWTSIMIGFDQLGIQLGILNGVLGHESARLRSSG